MLVSISTESRNSPLTFSRLSQAGHPLHHKKEASLGESRQWGRSPFAVLSPDREVPGGIC